MELQERLTHLENVRDWKGLAGELERAIEAGASNAVKAAYHLQLGRLQESKLLSAVKALKSFQDAYKLNPGLVESLEAARRIYWDLGKLNMVQKLLEMELKAAPGGPGATALLLELGDVLFDAGDYERAAATYARSLAVSNGTNAEAGACLVDVQAAEATWQEHVAGLLRTAHLEKGPARGRLFLRAARVVRRFAAAETEEVLAQAYAADPFSRQIAWLFEGILAEAGAFERLNARQAEIVLSLPSRESQGRAALFFGIRWIMRHQNTDLGARWLERRCAWTRRTKAPSVSRGCLRGTGGRLGRVVTIAEEAASRAGNNGNATFLLAQAGFIAWRQLGNMARARASFARLSAVAPDHDELRAFEALIGERLQPVIASTASAPVGGAAPPATVAEQPRPDQVDRAPAPEPPSAPSEGARTKEVVAPPPVVPVPAAVASVRQPPAPPPAAAVPERPAVAPAADASPAVDATPAPAHVAPSVAQVVAQTEPVDPAKIAELRALAEKQEATKRFNEYVKTLLQLAAMVPDATEKISLYVTAADLYVTKFANQAEAVKAYEHVLAIDPDHAQAVDYLRQMYEKRRDWEKLLGLQRREAERLDPGAVRGAKFLEMAKLATERVKKPDICIDLWREVLANDDANVEALSALSQLYDRAKDFEALAHVLERQVEVTSDAPSKIQALARLGTLYGDRLNNDEGAVTAWRTLLTLDPNDRKAQEALKKKYLALAMWDELEFFYAESAKWDELIRILEQQEAKETRPEAKTSLFFKIAQLWADKKQKNDRAAKAYEKVLELDPSSLRAAEALIPIYGAANNFRALAGVIEVKLAHETDVDAKLALFRQVASLYEGKVQGAGEGLRTLPCGLRAHAR